MTVTHFIAISSLLLRRTLPVAMHSQAVLIHLSIAFDVHTGLPLSRVVFDIVDKRSELATALPWRLSIGFAAASVIKLKRQLKHLLSSDADCCCCCVPTD